MARATLEIRGSVAVISDMTLKGGKLPKNFEITIGVVEIDFGGLTAMEIVEQFAAGGQSARVQLQRTMRERLTVENIKRIASEGLKIHASKINDVNAYMTQADRLNAITAEVKKMSREEREEYIRALRDM